MANLGRASAGSQIQIAQIEKRADHAHGANPRIKGRCIGGIPGASANPNVENVFRINTVEGADEAYRVARGDLR